MKKNVTPVMDEALTFLSQFPPGHEMPAEDVDHLLENELDCGYATLMKAKRRLKIESRRNGYKWVWVWPMTVEPGGGLL